MFTGYGEDSFFGLVGDDRSIALLLILPMFPPFVGGWAGGGGWSLCCKGEQVSMLKQERNLDLFMFEITLPTKTKVKILTVH